MYLINATQHPQNAQDWAALGVSFDSPTFAPFATISPNASIRDQVVAAWRKTLEEYTRLFESDIPCDGLLIGGFAPVVVGLYALASQFRIPTYTAIMGPAPMIDGKRRGFVLAGYRRIPAPKKIKKDAPIEGQPLPPETAEEIEAQAALIELIPEIDLEYFYLPSGHEVTRHDAFIHLSARPLTDARRGELANVMPHTLISVPPALPPAPESDLSGFQDGINAIAKVAFAEKCAILSDGAPAETLLRLYALLGHCVPFYYVKTKVTPATIEGGSPTHEVVGYEKIPRF